MRPQALRTIIFDLDGTLLDTERPYRAVFEETLRAHGRSIVAAEYHRLVGLSSFARANVLATLFGPGFEVAAFLQDYREARERMAARGIALKPGAAALLAELSGRGVRTGVATSASLATATSRIEASGLRPYLDAVLTRDHVAHGKPAPDVFLAVARALATPPALCLAVEDSPNGAAASLAAGMPTVVIPDLISAPPALAARCLAVLPDLHALAAILEPGQRSYVRVPDGLTEFAPT